LPPGGGPPVNFPIVGYRIDFRVGGGVLEAIVSGRSGFASAIAREIGEQARRSSVQHVLIDLRRLHDRLGRLRSLLAERHLPPRVAVIDVWQNDRFYIFAEMAARRLGCDLRRFEDHPAALAWLRSAELQGTDP
jgi:hypothetical protein